MIAWIRRRLALRRMSKRIDEAISGYNSVEAMLIAEAQHRLAVMRAEKFASPELVQYRKKRAAALKGRE